MQIAVTMPINKMHTIAMSWNVAKCSCPSWNASMDESALRRALASLYDCSSSLHWRLGFWTSLVVAGVALEIVFVVWEYVEDLHDCRRCLRVIVQVHAAGAGLSADVMRAERGAEALILELNKTNIQARRLGADLKLPPGVVVIRVGKKPNPVIQRILRDWEKKRDLQRQTAPNNH
jgi:hypothetical protein